MTTEQLHNDFNNAFDALRIRWEGDELVCVASITDRRPGFATRRTEA